MYRKRRPEDVANHHSASNATLSSTPAQSVSPLLPAQRPTYGSLSSVDESDALPAMVPGMSTATTPPGASGADLGRTTTAAAVETYKPVQET